MHLQGREVRVCTLFATNRQGSFAKEDDLRESIKNEKYVESNEFGGRTDPYGGCGACRETERTIKIEKSYGTGINAGSVPAKSLQSV